MNRVVRIIPVCSVQFDQYAPQGHGMIWHPAKKEAQHNDGDRFCNLGSAFGVAGFHTPFADEAQQHDVADGHDWHGQNKAYDDFLYVVER